MASDETSDEPPPAELAPPGTGLDLFYTGTVLPALQTVPPQIPDERVLGPLAHHLWGHGRISEALTCLRLLALRAPLGISHLLMQAYWDLYLGRSKAAHDGFAAALREEPADESARLGNAFALFYLEDYDAATEAFEALVRDAPRFTSPPVMAAASAALSQGKQPAEIKIAPLPGLPPGLAEAMQTGILHGDEGAIAYARNWIDRHPADALPLWRVILESHLDLGQDELAAELGAQLTETYKQDGPLTYLSAVAWRRVGRKDQSHDAFTDAAYLLATLEAGAWGGLAASQAERAEMTFAAAHFRIALFLDPSNPHFWGDLGQIELADNRYESAHHAFSEAIKLRQRTFINYYYRGLSAQGLGRDPDAIGDWALALEAEPAHPRAKEILQLVADRTAHDPDQRFSFGNIPATP
jgi:tetratricopeptide (TPR) repeat protein